MFLTQRNTKQICVLKIGLYLKIPFWWNQKYNLTNTSFVRTRTVRIAHIFHNVLRFDILVTFPDNVFVVANANCQRFALSQNGMCN